MNITVTADRSQNDQVIANLTVPADEVDKAIDKAYKDIAKKYNFQGFRRGRAPRPVVNGIVGRDAVLAQATEDLINMAQPQMLEELDVVPVGRPDYGEDVPAVVEHEQLSATATISVPPICELDSYDAPTIKMPPKDATEAEIDQQIEQLMGYHSSYEDVEEDRAAVEGDVVVVDSTNREGRAVPEGEGRQISLSSSYLPKEYVAGIVGMRRGETKDIEWTVEDDEGGSKAFSVTVTLKGFRKAVVPTLDDEFAKKNFGFDTVAEFRDAVKEEIEEGKESDLPRLKEDRVVEEAGKHLQIEKVPDAYGNQVFSELANEFLSQLQRQGLTLDMYLSARQIKSDAFLADLRVQADERARQSLALDALARHLEFDVTEDDIRNEFERADVEDVDLSVKVFTANGRMPAIRESIRRTKAVKWLVDNCTVVEVDEVAEARAKRDEPEDEVEQVGHKVADEAEQAGLEVEADAGQVGREPEHGDADSGADFEGEGALGQDEG